MGLIKSGGKGNSQAQTSSTTSTTNESTTINTVDNRAVQGDDARIGGNVTLTGTSGPITIETTDQGAVQAGLDLALESLGGIHNLVNANASVAKDSISQAYGLANQARQSETSGAINNALKYFALIAVIGIIAWAYARSRK